VVLRKSEAACVGTCLYGCFSFSVGYSVGLGGLLNLRQTLVRIESELPLPKQFEDLGEVGSPFIFAYSGFRRSDETVVDAPRILLREPVKRRGLSRKPAPGVWFLRCLQACRQYIRMERK
jgi:hypothetical protein